jgi:hypothetical protein
MAVPPYIANVFVDPFTGSTMEYTSLSKKTQESKTDPILR